MVVQATGTCLHCRLGCIWQLSSLSYCIEQKCVDPLTELGLHRHLRLGGPGSMRQTSCRSGVVSAVFRSCTSCPYNDEALALVSSATDYTTPRVLQAAPIHSCWLSCIPALPRAGRLSRCVSGWVGAVNADTDPWCGCLQVFSVDHAAADRQLVPKGAPQPAPEGFCQLTWGTFGQDTQKYPVSGLPIRCSFATGSSRLSTGCLSHMLGLQAPRCTISLGVYQGRFS